MRKILIVLAIAFTLITLANANAVESSDFDFSDKYSSIVKFSRSICNETWNAGSTRQAIQVKIAEEADVLAKILSSDASIGRYASDQIYKGIPFDRLPDTLPTVDSCKYKLTELLLLNERIPPGGAVGGSEELTPVREYLASKDIPPARAGAYGLVVFQYKETTANKHKLEMVCRSFVAFFPQGKTSDIPLPHQMITVWPVDNPNDENIEKDDCDYAVRHYDLIAAESAIIDAKRQHATFDGEGPYLIGWSPSYARGKPDKLVLVIDMSNDNNQAAIDHQFLFWKTKIVEDPSLWRHGFSINNIRVAIRDFANQYGQDLLNSVKLVGGR